MGDKTISIIEKSARKEIHNRRESAAHAGERGDGGAENLEIALKYWLDGINGRIPSRFQEYVDEYNKVRDPEYQEYLRLKDKFREN